MFLAARFATERAMTMFLVNGVMLQGADRRVRPVLLLLERGGMSQLVYKHAISTLQPEEPLDLGRGPMATTKPSPNEQFRRQWRDRGRARRAGRPRRARNWRAKPRGAPPKPGWRRQPGLAEAIGIQVVASRAFRVRTVRPATLLGKGQVEEIAGDLRRSRAPRC